MTSRDRILAALEHREPDRIPVDLSGHRSSGISAIAYARLRNHLGLPECPIRVYDPIQQLAIVDEDVLERFRVDTIELGRAFALDDADWADWVLPDGTPCQMPVWALPERDSEDWALRAPSGQVVGRMPPGVLYFEQCHYPFETSDDLDRLEAALDKCMWTTVKPPPGPRVSGPDGDRILADGARRLRDSSSRAIIALFGGNLLEIGQCLYRNDNFLILMATAPKRVHEFLDRLLALHLANLERFLNAVGPFIDIVLFGDDLGMQTGPQISPAMHREFFKPRQRSMWTRVKELADAKIMLHSCGGVRPLLPDLIDAGLDAINPVQISCRGMEPAELKADFGRPLTFWGGGCDTREILSRSTPTQIRDHVRRLMDIWRPGGGYVFQQVHNILADVPPENIVAMFDAVNEG